MPVNLLDIIIAILLLLGAIRGFQKGFFHEVATFLGLVAGVVVAIVSARMVGDATEHLFDWNVEIVKGVVFVVMFILILTIVQLLGSLLTSIFKALMLGFINKLAGFAVGALKWALLLSIFFMVIDFVDAIGNIITHEMRAGSYLYLQLERLSDWLLLKLGVYADVSETLFYSSINNAFFAL